MVQRDEESTSQEESIIIIKQNIQLRKWFFVNTTGRHNSMLQFIVTKYV